MIKKIINNSLSCMGYRIVKNRKQELPPLERFFSTWAKFGTSPELILDIGANHGNWTRKALKYFPTAQIVMIEPQERLKVHSEDLLKKPNVTWKTAGISDEIGVMELTLPPRDDSASFAITKEQAQAAGYPRIDVPVTTIKAIVDEWKRAPDMIKIDAEGFDYKALIGAADLVGTTEVLLVECAVSGRSMETTMERILPFLWSKDYQVMDITDLNISKKSGVLWLAELVFVHRDSNIWNKVTEY